MKNNEINYISIYKDKKYKEKGLILSFPKSFANMVKSNDIVINFESCFIGIREATILDYKSNKISKSKGAASTYATNENAEYYIGKYNFEKDGDMIYLTKII